MHAPPGGTGRQPAWRHVLLERGLLDPETVGHWRAVRGAACCVSHLLEKEFLKKSNQSPFTPVLSEFCRTHGYPGDSGVKEKCL